jgi:hypothetical protein
MIVASMLIPIGMQFITVETDCGEDINYYVPSVSTSIKIGMSNEHSNEASAINNVIPEIEDDNVCN